MILLSACFSVFFAATLITNEHLLAKLPGLTSPLYWAQLPILASTGSVALLPIAYWLAHSGQLHGQPHTPESQAPKTRWPTLRTVWPHLLVSLFFMVGSLVLTISLVA